MDRWYSQAGTPVVTVQQQYDASSKKFSLMLSQYTPSTPGQTQEEKLPVVIPVVVGLLDSASGKEIVPSTVLKLTEATQTFHFENVENKPVASVLRGFSAPVNLEFDQQTDEDLIFLMGYDTDSFNKWDAGNRYFTKLLLSMADMPMDAIDKVTIPENFINAIKLVLESAKKGGDMSLVAYALQMPDTMTLLNQLKSKDVDRLHKARKFLKETIATKLYAEFEEIYTLSADAGNEYKFNPQVNIKKICFYGYTKNSVIL